MNTIKIKFGIFLFAITSFCACFQNHGNSYRIENTSWKSIDGLGILEFHDSTCLYIQTSSYTGHKDSMTLGFTTSNDTVIFTPKDEDVIVESSLIITDSGLVNINRGIVSAIKIK